MRKRLREKMNSWLRRESGQSLVEFVLILPILLIFVVSIGDLGWAIYQKDNLDNMADAVAKSVWRYEADDAKDYILFYIKEYYPQYDLSKMNISVDTEVEAKKYDTFFYKGESEQYDEDFFKVPMYYAKLITRVSLDYEVHYLTPWGKLIFSDTDNNMTVSTEATGQRLLVNDSMFQYEGSNIPWIPE